MTLAFGQSVLGAQGTSGFTIEVDGLDLDEAIAAFVQRVEVIDRLKLPDTFVIRFLDLGGDILGRAGLDVGKSVVIKAIGLKGQMPETLVSGEVTSIGADYDATGRTAVVTGYDKSHRLAAGRRTTTYQDVKYSDIASQIAARASLVASVDQTDGTFKHVIQPNESDLEFMYELAEHVGFDFRVDGDTLIFKKPVESATAPGPGELTTSDPLQLVWGANLLEFRARLSAVAQVSSVEVRGWDPVAKEPVVGTADAAATNVQVGLSPADLAQRVGGQTMVVVNHGAATQSDAERLAKARAEQIGSAAYEATAVTHGNPALKVGTAVSVAGVEPALCGRWVVSGSRHVLGGGPYRTHLEFAGRQDRTLTGLATRGTASAGAIQRMPGVVVAIVDANDDPESMGRVRLTFPWMGEGAVSYWARLSAPGAGNGYGVTFIPQVGDEVLVAFEQGDPSRPFVLGGLWNGQDAVPFDSQSGLDNGQVTNCAIVSRSGHRITFIESSSESRVEIVSSGQNVTIHLDDDAKALKITSKGDVTIETDGNTQIAAHGNVQLTADGSATIEAKQNVTIKGATVALN